MISLIVQAICAGGGVALQAYCWMRESDCSCMAGSYPAVRNETVVDVTELVDGAELKMEVEISGSTAMLVAKLAIVSKKVYWLE